MPSKKISALTPGNPIQVTDEIPINRSGLNYKVTIARYVTDWSVINANQSLVAGNGYFTTGASQLVLPLPTISVVGDTIVLKTNNANGFEITQGASQVITFGNQNTTPGISGSLETTAIGNSLKIVCSVANVQWDIFYPVGVLIYN